MKKQTSKLRKLERSRIESLFTDNMDYCFVCGKPKQNIHEVFEGAKRLKSIEYKLILPLCFSCHQRIHNDRQMALFYKQKGQELFNENYPDLDFIQIFHKGYL